MVCRIESEKYVHHRVLKPIDPESPQVPPTPVVKVLYYFRCGTRRPCKKRIAEHVEPSYQPIKGDWFRQVKLAETIWLHLRSKT